MLVPWSQLLLTSCAGPWKDEAAWGELVWTGSNQQQQLPFICDPVQGLRMNTSDSQRIKGPLLESLRTLDSWRPPDDNNQHVSNRFALEVWLTPASEEEKDADSIRPLITIMPLPSFDSQTNDTATSLLNDTAGPSAETDPFCDGEVDCELSSYRGHLLLRFRTDDTSSTCRTLFLSSDQLIQNELLQLMVVFEYDSDQSSNLLSVFWNGQALYTAVTVNSLATRPLLQTWSPSSALMLFGNPIHTTPFRGALAQVSLYGEDDDDDPYAMDDDGEDIYYWVQQRFRQGPTRSDPLMLFVAQSAIPVRIDQDASDPIDIVVQSRNVSTPWFQIAVQVVTIPTHGTLYYAPQSSASDGSQKRDSLAGSTIVTAGTLLVFPMSARGEPARMIFQYMLYGTDYFHEPSTNAYGDTLPFAPEVWEYRLVAQDAKGRQLAVSESVAQPITVVHVNHPPMLTGPTIIDPNNFEDNMAILTGIALDDAARDYNIDRVRVDVWATSGYLTLYPLDGHLADFDSCRGRTFSPWQCVGDGVRNRNMTFIAVPDDISGILHNLTYEAMMPDQADAVVVRVSDGQDGDCLNAAEQQQYTDTLGYAVVTSQRGCFQVELQIHVPGLEFDPNQQKPVSSSRGFLGTRLNTARLLFWSLVLALIVCGGCCLRRCSRCLARGSKVDVTMDESDDEDEESTVGGYGRRASF